MSYMLYKCNLLLSLPDIDKMNTSQVIDMSKLFCGCESLLPFLIYQNGIHLKLII